MTQSPEQPPYSYRATSLKEIASACGVATETITGWIKRGHLERREMSKRQYEYDLLAFVRFAERLKLDKEFKAKTNKLQTELDELKEQLSDTKVSVSDASSQQLKDAVLRQQIREKDFEHARKCRLLCSWENVQEFYEFFAAQIRRAGELLRKHHGPDAQLLFDEALTIAEREWVSLSDRLHREEHDELTPGGRVSKRPVKNGSPLRSNGSHQGNSPLASAFFRYTRSG